MYICICVSESAYFAQAMVPLKLCKRALLYVHKYTNTKLQVQQVAVTNHSGSNPDAVDLLAMQLLAEGSGHHSHSLIKLSTHGNGKGVVANHGSAKLKWSLYVSIIHEEEEEGFGGGGGGKEDKVDRKKDKVQKKRQEEDKKEMEYVMDFV